MKFLRWLPATAFAVIVLIGTWVWWNRPQPTDMAAYAPADALVYLECNSLLDILDAIASTSVWKELRPLTGNDNYVPSRWLTRAISWTGIGSTRTVIVARAQLAGVMLELGAKEQGETLTIKPEAVILVETHTSESRIRATVEEGLKSFAEKSYGQATLKRTVVSDSELLVWSASENDRQIVAAIDGSLVIVGNSERAVKACLEVRRGQRPSLKSQTELQQMRQHLATPDTLAFGFISSANAARLFSSGAPLLFGGGTGFERIIATSAAKVLGAVGWSSRGLNGGIEDRYLFSLQSPVVSRLQTQFRPTNKPIQVPDLLPQGIHSLSVYRFESPLATWQTLETTLSSQLDTLSAMFVSSLQKSALTTYGIDDPEKFLSLIGTEVSTVRVTPNTERSILIAEVQDEASLRQLLVGRGSQNPEVIGDRELIEIPAKSLAVSFVNGRVMIGPTPDIKLLLQEMVSDKPSHLDPKVEHFISRSSSANVITYTEESDRVIKFLQAVWRATGTRPLLEPDEITRKTRQLPYSTTETTLGDRGLERITRSSFGQFASLVSLLFPER